MSEIHFFRHAQASYMTANYDKLSSNGETQSAILGNYLAEKGNHFDQTFVGSLVRQKETFDIVAAAYQEKGLDIPKPEILAALNEHTGPKALKLSYEKLLKEDKKVKEMFPTAEEDLAVAKKKLMLIFKYFMKKWVTGQFTVDHPEVEPWDQFRKRVKTGLDIILEKTKSNSKVAVFTSGGVISAITAESMGLKDETVIADLNYSVRNTSITKFYYSNGEFNLLSFNEVPHLEGEMITFV